MPSDGRRMAICCSVITVPADISTAANNDLRVTFPHASFQCGEGKYFRAHAQWHGFKRVRVILVLRRVLHNQPLQLFNVGKRIVGGQPHHMLKSVLAGTLEISVQHIRFAAAKQCHIPLQAMLDDGIVQWLVAGGDNNFGMAGKPGQSAQHMIKQCLTGDGFQYFAGQTGRAHSCL